MPLLSQYIVQVRRLLNDAQRNYWQDSELTDYINEGRRQTAVDTLCVRKYQATRLDGSPVTLITNQEQYTYTDPGVALPQGNQVYDIINITLIWGNTRVPLGYAPFTLFSGYFRTWTQYRRLPAAFTIYNQNEYWVGYVPDQNYQAEFDTAILPLNLVSDNSVDSIPLPYSEAVKYYAASLARLKLQQYAEHKVQEKLYIDKIAQLGAMPPRRIPYVFQNDVF